MVPKTISNYACLQVRDGLHCGWPRNRIENDLFELLEKFSKHRGFQDLMKMLQDKSLGISQP